MKHQTGKNATVFIKTENVKPKILFIKPVYLTQINLIRTTNIVRVAVKPLLKNGLPIIKNHLTTTNKKIKRNF